MTLCSKSDGIRVIVSVAQASLTYTSTIARFSVY